MASQFRQSMSWLHTWAGLVLSTLIFAIFWMGTLSVFDREIDQWMMPSIRSSVPLTLSVDDILLPVVVKLEEEHSIRQWGVTMPNARTPFYSLFYQNDGGEFFNARINPNTGTIIDDSQTLGATGFIFPFHYRLNISWRGLGYWLVGLAAMAMMALLVTGVILHKKIFKDFFTFRPRKQLQRASLDLHNLSGVVALPFHFLITLSGLIIFISIYFPNASELAYAEHRNPAGTFFSELGDRFARPVTHQAAEAKASLTGMVEWAEQHWGEKVGFIRVHNVGDMHAVVQLGRAVQGEVNWNIDKLYFDAVTGELLHESTTKPMMAVQRFFVGMHFIQFDHWPLRWLYFIAGLGSCVMIGTGFVYWLAARRKRHARQGLAGIRIVEGLAIGSVTGIILATLAFWIANRLLPVELQTAGMFLADVERAELETWCFYGVWVLSFVHAFALPRRALVQQCIMITLAAVLAVLLNMATTEFSLLPNNGQVIWPVAIMDLLLLAGAALAAYAAFRLKRSGSVSNQTTKNSSELTDQNGGEYA